ncbi:dedicator of cytokinesis protein [Trichophyton mentagrophytes]|nr:dedicator of cytokinesis protein [Trichophyton mentagrophytes]
MPWKPLPRIAFAVAVYPFQPSSPADLPLELGDELYIIEQGGASGEWYRGYLVAPPSLLAGLTSVRGQTLEARVFSGIFPRNCVEVREVLGDADEANNDKPRDSPGVVVNGDSRSIAAASPDNGQPGDIKPTSRGLAPEVKTARKLSPLTILKLEEDATKRRSGMSTQTTAVASLTSPPPAAAPAHPLRQDSSGAKPAAPVPMLKIGDETPTSMSEPLVDEIASCLREWHSTNIHGLLLGRQYATLESMSNIVLELDLARRQLLHNVLTAQERKTLREETVWNLVRGNKMLSGDVIVRDPAQRGRLLTGDDSAIELTKLQSEMSMLDGKITHPSDTVSLHHLLFELDAVTGTISSPIVLAVSLCLQSPAGDVKPLSETYALDVPSAESFSSLAVSGKLKTLFTELSAADIGEISGADSKLFLVVKVLSWEAPRTAPILSKSHSSSGSSTSRAGAQFSNAGKGSLRGRRSMMWGPKGSKGGQPVDPAAKEATNNAPPRSSDGTDKEKQTAAPPKKKDPVCRTIGVGAIEVGPLVKAGKSTEQVFTIWSPLNENEEEDANADGFHEIIRSLIYSPTGRYTRSYQAARLHTHLYPFTSTDADALVKKNPTLLHSVTQTRRIGFPGAPTKPRSDIYVTLSRANISRDALLSHPVHGQVPVPQSTGLRNIQLTLEVRNSSGARVEKCICPSSNATPVIAWRTTVTERLSSWNQTIRLSIPADQVPGSHLIMSIADAPEFPFALSWMPLWDQQAFIRDGPHSLLLHAYDKSTSSIENGKGAYLSLPWSALGKNECTKDEAVTGPMATLIVETDLCSTEYSQDQVMLGLLNWKEKPASELLELLRRLVFVPEIEIVKQLSNVFDALFGIIVEHSGHDEFEDLVFTDIVTVLGILHDRRFNLGPLVDQYAKEQFNFPFATPCLIRSYCRLLQATPDSQQSRNLRAAFKVGRHILKFIINAREQQKAKEEGIGITNIQSTFNRDLTFIFKSVEALMQNPAPILVGSKTLVVQHFHTWLPELSSALTRDEIVDIALSFMDSCKDVKGMLILYKLVLIQNYFQLSLFAGQKERKMLYARCAEWLDPYWGAVSEVTDQYRDQVRLCSSIIAEQLKHPEPELFEYMPKVVASYCAIAADGVEESNWLSLLFSKSFPFQLKQSKTSQKFDEALVELSALTAALSAIPNPVELVMEQDEMAIFLSRAFTTHISILDCVPYPATWLSLRIYHHRSVVKSLEHWSAMLIKSFLPPVEEADTFDMELWRLFFATILKLVSSDALALETFPEQKRRAVWKIAGDVREHGAELLRTTWKAIGWETTPEERDRFGLDRLGGYQVQYVPSLVPPIIELCLSVHEGPRRVAVEILQTMLVSEWQLNEDLAMIEAEIISSLDETFKTRNFSESITQKLFMTELMELFDSKSETLDSELMVALKELVATVDELLDLLAAAHSGNISESLNTLKLMEFMKDMDKEDIFIRYVHELAKGQVAARNFTEAGLALQFHADLYNWDSSQLLPALAIPEFPEQSAFDRKEALYFQIIQHFEDGKAWAHALACYRELADQYEHTTLDFAKLSRTQTSMARIYDSIVRDDIQVARYFRVTFKGLGFPATVRDKQYIFEGHPTDRLASFTDRLQKEYPAAQLITSGEIEDLEGQFLRVSAVSIHRDMNHPVYQRTKVPQSVRDHLLTSVPAQFSVTSKKHLNGNNVKKQWVEKTIYTVAEPFPNILRRSEIVATDEVSLTPLQTAIERTWRKTQELIILERRATLNPDANLTAVAELIRQLVDVEAQPSTCAALYRQFLQEDYDMDVPTENGDVDGPAHSNHPLRNALATALIEHAVAIKRCLMLFNLRPSYQSDQIELVRQFESIFSHELATFIPVAGQFQEDNLPTFNRFDPFANTQAPRVQDIQNDGPQPKPSLSRSLSNAVSEAPSRRLSLNLFRRSHHGPSNSVTTITQETIRSNSSLRNQSISEGMKLNGTTMVNEPLRTPTSPSNKTDMNERKGSLSAQSKTDGTQKRRSWFGNGSTTSSNNGNATEARPSCATTPSTEDIKTTQQRIIERAKAARKQNGTTYSTIPQTRPSTNGSNRTGISARSGGQHSPISPLTNNSGGSSNMSASAVRDSVMRRLSLLKSGRKASRANFREGGAMGGAVKEE